MTVLIIYATVEGQTGKIADFIEAQIGKAGLETRRVDATDKMAQVSFDGVDKVIMAGSVHERRHPKAFEILITSLKHELDARDTLLLSVSLSAAFPEGLADAQDYVDEMAMRTGVTPDQTALVAGAVRSQHYDYYASQVVRHVVLRGKDVDPNATDHEFTDWAALKSKVAAFIADPAHA